MITSGCERGRRGTASSRLGVAKRAPRRKVLSPGSPPAWGRGRTCPLLGSGTFGVMELHVGCPMWTYAPWQGRYLPGSLPPRERLRAYATWCNAVEGNTTFYATPALGTVRSWAEQTAP